MAERYCSGCVRRLVILSSVLVQIDFILVLAIVHCAAMNIGMNLSFKIMVSSESVPRNGIAGSCGTSLFGF